MAQVSFSHLKKQVIMQSVFGKGGRTRRALIESSKFNPASRRVFFAFCPSTSRAESTDRTLSRLDRSASRHNQPAWCSHVRKRGPFSVRIARLWQEAHFTMWLVLFRLLRTGHLQREDGGGRWGAEKLGNPNTGRAKGQLSSPLQSLAERK